MVTFNEVFYKLPVGWLDMEEALLMFVYAQLAEGPILEVGSFYGRSAVLLAQLGRPLYCVDPFEGFDTEDMSGEKALELFEKNTGPYPNIKLFKMKIEDWEPQPVGFAYLDGDHTYEGTIRQIEKALQCNSQYIAMHDVNDTGDGKSIQDAALKYLGPWILRAGKMAVFKVK